MHLIIDGYNLLYSGQAHFGFPPNDLQIKRDNLIDRLSAYGKNKPLNIVVVFDGWQGGWGIEKKEKKKGMTLIFSKLGEKADEVIKRLLREKGSGVMVVTSDRDISSYAERMSIPVIPSDQFRERMGRAPGQIGKDDEEEKEEREFSKKGPSRRPSKKEKRLRAAWKKL